MKMVKKSMIYFLIIGALFLSSCKSESNTNNKTEENLRARIDDYYKCLNARKFDLVVREYQWCEEKRSEEEIKEEIRYYREETLLGFYPYEYKIENIKIIDDVAYVFVDEMGARWVDIWIFKNNNWYYYVPRYGENGWPLEDDTCKDLPVVFLNVKTEMIDSSSKLAKVDTAKGNNSEKKVYSVRINWETDEEVESEITYRPLVGDPETIVRHEPRSYFADIPREKTISIPGVGRYHEIVIEGIEEGQTYGFVLWAKIGDKRCHSEDFHFLNGELTWPLREYAR